MKETASRTSTAPNSPHATPTLPLRYASRAPCRVIANRRDAYVVFSLLWPCPAAARIYPRSAPISSDDRHAHLLRQNFAALRHGVPVPILPMSRERSEELEPREKRAHEKIRHSDPSGASTTSRREHRLAARVIAIRQLCDRPTSQRRTKWLNRRRYFDTSDLLANIARAAFPTIPKIRVNRPFLQKRSRSKRYWPNSLPV
jgi:hypothetical protein